MTSIPYILFSVSVDKFDFSTLLFWKRRRSAESDVASSSFSSSSAKSAPEDEVEEPPETKEVGVSLRGLTKSYGRGKLAVSDLSLDFFVGEVTGLLGHNGAGKSTAM